MILLDPGRRTSGDTVEDEFDKLPAALARVHSSDVWSGTRLLMEFLVLTVVRTNEARGALWSEIDLDSARWLVPQPVLGVAPGSAWRLRRFLRALLPR